MRRGKGACLVEERVRHVAGDVADAVEGLLWNVGIMMSDGHASDPADGGFDIPRAPCGKRDFDRPVVFRKKVRLERNPFAPRRVQAQELFARWFRKWKPPRQRIRKPALDANIEGPFQSEPRMPLFPGLLIIRE